jgi:hypothetical protein
MVLLLMSSSSLLTASGVITPLRRVSLSRREMSVSYAPFDAEGVIVGVVYDDENIKQLLNLSTIFVVDVKVVLYL